MNPSPGVTRDRHALSLTIKVLNPMRKRARGMKGPARQSGWAGTRGSELFRSPTVVEESPPAAVLPERWEASYQSLLATICGEIRDDDRQRVARMRLLA